MRDPTVELFEKAVALHSRRLLAIARGIVGSAAAAEDVLQTAIMNLYRHRARYDWTAPEGPMGLMRRTVVNEALRTLRAPKMGLVMDDHPDDEGRGGRQSPPGQLMDQEAVDLVRACIAELPDHFRAALVLCEY